MLSAEPAPARLVSPPRKFRIPTTVVNDTSKTNAAPAAANCENDNSQVRLIQLETTFRRSVVAAAVVTGAPASITLRIRSHSACSFGGALYSPRCARQKLRIESRS